MTTKGFRIQIVSDSESINALAQVASDDLLASEPQEIPTSDQRFGIAEAAAIVAIVHTSTQIAELLVKAYKDFRGHRKYTIRTPKGSVTIEGDSTTRAEAIIGQIDEARIL